MHSIKRIKVNASALQSDPIELSIFCIFWLKEKGWALLLNHRADIQLLLTVNRKFYCCCWLVMYIVATHNCHVTVMKMETSLGIAKSLPCTHTFTWIWFNSSLTLLQCMLYVTDVKVTHYELLVSEKLKKYLHLYRRSLSPLIRKH